MDQVFTLRVIASDKIFYEGKCCHLIVPATDGSKGILANHENMVIALTTGAMRLQKEDGTWLEAVVGVGFAQIANNRVTVLVVTAERPEEIDVRRAQQAKERAEEQLRQKLSLQQYHMSQASLARAMSRLKMSSKYNDH